MEYFELLERIEKNKINYCFEIRSKLLLIPGGHSWQWNSSPIPVTRMHQEGHDAAVTGRRVAYSPE